MYASSTINFGTSISLTWTGDRSNDEKKTAYGTVDSVAEISMAPPEKSLAGFWGTTFDSDLNTDLFRLDCPANTVIDICFQYVLGDSNTKTVVVNAPSFNGVGYAHLNNATTTGGVGSNLLVPQGVTLLTITTP